jgi:hypothetical protein
MQVVFGLVEETGNMHVEMINLGVPTKKFVGRMRLGGLFRPFFRPIPQIDNYFAVQSYLGSLLELL